MGQGEVGVCTQTVQSAWPCLHGLRPELAPVGGGGGGGGGGSIPTIKAHFSATSGCHFPRALI